MISKRTIDKIYEAAAIEEVVGDFVHLKRSGKNFRALSPFTNEKTPSFYVVPHKGIYKCFSSGKGGNVVNFLMEHEKISYPEALRWLAAKYNIEIEEEQMSEEAKEAQSEREALGVVVDFAQKWFEEQLWNSEDGQAIGLSYFKERGFREDTIKNFGLGYCPDKWDEFTKVAIQKGYKLDLLEKAGLTKERNGSPYDFLRGRVIFPIRNISGKNIGFGARTLRTDKKTAKYFNSPDSELYHKSKVLFGIDKAKAEILKEDNCFLVEGYTDVISLNQSELVNVVSSSGTALTEDQIRLIKRFTKHVTILFDGDAAGIRASFRGINMLLAQGMAVKVVLFPDGDDPDSYAKRVSSTELKEYVKSEAKDFIVFKTDLLANETKDDPLKRAELIRDIVETIAVIPDGIQRSVYTQECSRLLDIPEETLIFEINKIQREKAKRQSRPQQEEPPPPSPDDFPPYMEEIEDAKGVSASAQESELIRLLLQFGTCMIQIQVTEEGKESEDDEGEEASVSVAEYIWMELHGDGVELRHPILKKIYDEFMEILDQQQFPDEKLFTHHDDPEVCRIAADLLTVRYEMSENWEHKHEILSDTEEHQIHQAARDTVNRLKLVYILRLIHEIGEDLKNEELNDEAVDLLFKRKMQLDKAKQRISAYFGTAII